MEKKIRNPFSMKCVYAGPEQMGKKRPAPANDPQKQEQKTPETDPQPAYPMNFAADPGAQNPMTAFMAVYAGPPMDPKHVPKEVILNAENGSAPAKSRIPGEPAPFCKVCGNEFKENAKFCTECGSPRAYVKTCPSCAAKVPADCGFCIFCGAALNSDK